MQQLAVLDYVVIIVSVVGVALVGVVAAGRQKTLGDFYLAGGNMPWWSVSISMYANLLSPISFLGVAGWIYQKDSRWFVGNAVVGLITIYFAASLWIPLWSRLRPLSIFEYLEQRFHPGLRIFGGLMFAIQMVFWIGNQLVVTADALEHTTRVPALYCLTSVCIAITIYAMIGGARADIWTDVMHFGIFVFALIVVGMLVLSHFHWEPFHIYEVAASKRSSITGYPPTQIISAELDLSVEGAIWAIIFHRLVGVLSFGTEQLTVQRMLATGGRVQMYRALGGFAVLDVLCMMMTVSVSWGLIAFYQTNPDAAMPGHPDQMMAVFVRDYVPTFGRGLVIAGLLAALMASYDSGLNSIGSVTINDFYRRFFAPGASDRHYLLVSRCVCVAASCIVLVFALWQYQHREATALQRIGRLSALVGAPVACCFMLGVFSVRTNTPGAILGAFAALAFSILFNGISGFFEPLIPGVNWVWVGGLSIGTGLVTGRLASLLFAPNSPEKLNGLTVRRL